MRVDICLFVIITLLLFSGCLQEDFENGDAEYDDFVLISVFDDLDYPWGMDFYEDDKLFITKRESGLVLVDLEDGEKYDITGVPDFVSVGQGGMLDVEYDGGYVYLSYVAENSDGKATYLGRGEFDYESYDILDFEVLYVVEPFLDGGSHFGSRVVTYEDYVFLSTGDRGDKNFDESHISQDTSNSNGAIVRLYRNGSIPSSNPYVDDDSIKSSIYTYGHRNVQGMVNKPDTDEIWISEHGERDGDVISRLNKGGNYGWPLAHYGCEYGTANPVGEKPDELDWVEQPQYYWECQSGGFPPAGMDFYSGDKFEEWQGDLFVGNLAGQYLGRFSFENGELVEKDPILDDRGWRIRDVEEAPGGELYVLVDGSPGRLVKLG